MPVGNCRYRGISSVSEDNDGWSISTADGENFWVPREYGVQPLVGQLTRFYGSGPCCEVRGFDTSNVEYFYRTALRQDVSDARSISDGATKQKA